MTARASLRQPCAADAPQSSFAADCGAGLSQVQKSLPCKWLYDDAGSQWFERITALPEYYPSRAEETLLDYAAAHIVGTRSLVELGSGASRKTRRLLTAANTIERYVPIYISRAELDRARAWMQVALLGPRFTRDAGETVHTENSHKLAPAHWRALFAEAGWRIDADWQSPPPAFFRRAAVAIARPTSAAATALAMPRPPPPARSPAYTR